MSDQINDGMIRIRYLGEWMFVSREAARLICMLRREAMTTDER